MAGKLIMLITKTTRDETFYYVANAKEKKMNKTIQDIKNELSNGTLNSKETEEKSEEQKRL
jgi:ERCC4-related helicase